MARFRNTVTGSVVNVDDVTAGQLGAEWVSADAEKREPAKRTTRQKKTSTDEK